MIELVAHRAGNNVAALRRAESIADSIELDVHLGRSGELEARHAKTLWPTRRLWERWYLLPRDTPVVSVADIVAAARPETHLWLDLKGVSPRLAAAAEQVVDGRACVTVSSKSWWLLRRFHGQPGRRTFRSAGNRFELLLARWLPSRVRTDGTVAHQRLLDPGVIGRLVRRGQVFTWAVTDVDRIAQLAAAGVDGVIVDELDLIGAARDAVDRQDPD